MPYIHTSKRMDDDVAGHQIKPWTRDAIVAHLSAHTKKCRQADEAGRGALAHVLALATDEAFRGKTVSSVRARILKRLGQGWGIETTYSSGTCICNGDARIYIPDHILDPTRIANSNTCYAAGADERLAKATDVGPIADAMLAYVEAACALAKACKGAAYVKYTPWTSCALELEARP